MTKKEMQVKKGPMAWIMTVQSEIVHLVPRGVAEHYEKIGTAFIIGFLTNGRIH